MKHRSFIGPILLIALGAALLARNWYPELRWTDAIARYWPYVLIAWGGLRVIEIVVGTLRGRPLPARGVSGGEWVLVVFLCLIGSGIHAARSLTVAWPGAFTMGGVEVFGERFEYPVNVEKTVSKTPRVVIENARGDVQITGADADTVKVTGRRATLQGTVGSGPVIDLETDRGEIFVRKAGAEALKKIEQ